MPTTLSGGSQIFGRWTKRIDGPPAGLGLGEFAVSIRSRRVFVGTDGEPIVLGEVVASSPGGFADPGDLVALLESGLLSDPQSSGLPQTPTDLDLATLFETDLL